MTRDEWIARYAKRIEQEAQWDADSAMQAALAGAEVYEADERAAGNAVEWEAPEDAADEEMSYWTEDGDE